jgi:hypothetical protein
VVKKTIVLPNTRISYNVLTKAYPTLQFWANLSCETVTLRQIISVKQLCAGLVGIMTLCLLAIATLYILDYQRKNKEQTCPTDDCLFCHLTLM